MSSEPTETCMFFVDDSNIWIEAQKFSASGNSHMPKLTGRDRDPRLRINIGKLVSTLSGHRNQGPSFLYGSRPPPNDSVWNAFKNHQFKTSIFDRNKHDNKEKEVDNAMATGLSVKATELRVRAEYTPESKQLLANTTFVVITGDRDMVPPVQEVLECGIRVELWAWKSGIATAYLALDSSEPGLSVQYLDSVFDKIYFTNFLSTRKTGMVQPSQTIVLCEFAEAGEYKKLELSVGRQLVRLGHLFYITRTKAETEMFVEFPDIQGASGLDSILLKVREMFKGTLTVRSWPESRFSKEPPTMLEFSNMYAPLKDDGSTAKEERQPVDRKAKPSSTTEPEGGHGEIEATQSLNDPDPDGDNDGWTPVTRSNPTKGHHRAIRREQPCPHGIRCEKRGECGYVHTDEERRLFQGKPRQNFRLWKTAMCNKPYCRDGKRCAFAHSQDEAWCLRCHVEGHFIDECQHRR
ncbi:hypothetical protein ACJ41O_010733 [Fusarium nematophilum]